MSSPELHETLTALIEALDAMPHPDAPRVVAAEVEAPMEVQVVSRDGALTARASPPSSAWATGVMAPVHHVRITAGEMALPPDDTEVPT